VEVDERLAGRVEPGVQGDDAALESPPPPADVEAAVAFAQFQDRPGAAGRLADGLQPEGAFPDAEEERDRAPSGAGRRARERNRELHPAPDEDAACSE
jgi:hypothetical protein